MTNKALYVGVLIALIFLLAASLGSGLWNQPADYTSWPYRMFRGLCHQLPDRSLSINSIPMAVNARCFGLFSGLATGWLLLPLFLPLLKSLNRITIVIILFATGLQIIDYMAGRTGIWSSGNLARMAMGAILGFAVVTTIGGLFLKNINRPS